MGDPAGAVPTPARRPTRTFKDGVRPEHLKQREAQLAALKQREEEAENVATTEPPGPKKAAPPPTPQKPKPPTPTTKKPPPPTSSRKGASPASPVISPTTSLEKQVPPTIPPAATQKPELGAGSATPTPPQAVKKQPPPLPSKAKPAMDKAATTPSQKSPPPPPAKAKPTMDTTTSTPKSPPPAPPSKASKPTSVASPPPPAPPAKEGKPPLVAEDPPSERYLELTEADEEKPESTHVALQAKEKPEETNPKSPPAPPASAAKPKVRSPPPAVPTTAPVADTSVSSSPSPPKKDVRTSVQISQLGKLIGKGLPMGMPGGPGGVGRPLTLTQIQQQRNKQSIHEEQEEEVHEQQGETDDSRDTKANRMSAGIEVPPRPDSSGPAPSKPPPMVPPSSIKPRLTPQQQQQPTPSDDSQASPERPPLPTPFALSSAANSPAPKTDMSKRDLPPLPPGSQPVARNTSNTSTGGGGSSSNSDGRGAKNEYEDDDEMYEVIDNKRNPPPKQPPRVIPQDDMDMYEVVDDFRRPPPPTSQPQRPSQPPAPPPARREDPSSKKGDTIKKGESMKKGGWFKGTLKKKRPSGDKAAPLSNDSGLESSCLIGLGHDTPILAVATANATIISGDPNYITLDEKEVVDVIKMEGTPTGKWAVRKNTGEVGLVDCDRVTVDRTILKAIMKGVKVTSPLQQKTTEGIPLSARGSSMGIQNSNSADKAVPTVLHKKPKPRDAPPPIPEARQQPIVEEDEIYEEMDNSVPSAAPPPRPPVRVQAPDMYNGYDSNVQPSPSDGAMYLSGAEVEAEATESYYMSGAAEVDPVGSYYMSGGVEEEEVDEVYDVPDPMPDEVYDNNEYRGGRQSAYDQLARGSRQSNISNDSGGSYTRLEKGHSDQHEEVVTDDELYEDVSAIRKQAGGIRVLDIPSYQNVVVAEGDQETRRTSAASITMIATYENTHVISETGPTARNSSEDIY